MIRSFRLQIFSLLFVISSSVSSQQQDPFINSFIHSTTQINDLHTDSNGDIYIIGSSRLQGYLPLNYDTLWYISKHQPDGTELWNIKIHSPETICLFSHICNDKLFVCGNFSGNLYYPGGWMFSNGKNDIFYFQIATDGSIAAYKEGGPGNELVEGFAVHQNEELFVAGSVQGDYEIGLLSGKTDSITTGFLYNKKNIITPQWTKVADTKDGCSFWDLIIEGQHLYFFAGGDIDWNNNGTPSSTYNYVVTDLDGTYVRSYITANSQLESNNLQFVDSQSHLYFIQHFGWKQQDDTYIRNIGHDGTEHWKFDCSYQRPYSIMDAGEYIFWFSHDHFQGITKKPVQRSHHIKLNMNNYWAFGRLKSYIDDKLVLYGHFSDSVTLGPQQYFSDVPITGYVAILDQQLLTDIEEHQRDNDGFKIYPNPASTAMTIESEKSGTLIIINQLGKQIMMSELKEGKNLIDLSHLHPGFYSLCLETAAQKKFVKIVRE